MSLFTNLNVDSNAGSGEYFVIIMTGNVYEFLNSINLSQTNRKVPNFLDHLLKVGKSKSAETYYYQLKLYAKHLGVKLEELDYTKIDPLTLSECMAKLDSPNSANTLLAAVKSYAKYLKKTAKNREEYNDFSWFYDSIAEVEYRPIPRIPTVEKGIEPKHLVQLFNIVYEDGDYHLLSSLVTNFYLGNRPVELAHEFRVEPITFKEEKAVRKIDFENKLISIITAKSKGSMRIIPIDDRVLPFFKVWYENLDKVLRVERPREWLTRRVRKYKKYGFNITAKTARQTFETEMRSRMDQWKVNYILGHAGSTPDIYTGWKKIINEDLRKELAEKHYLFDDVFDEFWEEVGVI